MASDSFVVTVKQLTGELLEVRCDPMDSVLMLKQRICTLIPDVEVHRQTLILPLSDDEPAHDVDTSSGTDEHIKMVDAELCASYGLDDGSLILLLIQSAPTWLDLDRVYEFEGLALQVDQNDGVLRSVKYTQTFGSVQNIDAYWGSRRYAVSSVPLPSHHTPPPAHTSAFPPDPNQPLDTYWALELHQLGCCIIGVIGNNETNHGASNCECPEFSGWFIKTFQKFRSGFDSLVSVANAGDVFIFKFRAPPLVSSSSASSSSSSSRSADATLTAMNLRTGGYEKQWLPTSWEQLPPHKRALLPHLQGHIPYYLTVTLLELNNGPTQVKFRHATLAEQQQIDQES